MAAAVFLARGSRRCTSAPLRRFALWAGLLFFGALALRLALGYTTQGYQADIDAFKAWGRILNEVGFSRMYRQDIFLDYPPGYLYVLLFLEKLRGLLGLGAGRRRSPPS